MTTNADSIYADHLASHAGVTSDEARAAEEAAFAALIEANPEHAEALEELRAAQRRLGGAIPRTLSDKTSGLHRPAGAKELPQSAFHAREGATVGDFRLTRLLGRGGMGEVWEAEQASLSRKVALKLMLPDRVSERGLDFFAREARAGGRLAHQGIVSVFGTGEDEGAHWIAMELVEGACDLRRSLDAMRDGGELPEDYYEDTAEFLAKLADALQVAHQAGVIHRDLKPANILVAADDSPKVSDFGLAKLEDELSISSAGELLGTYYYMSPEQVATKRAGIDHRTDNFSLGVVMYEMLTLVRPFEGDTTEQVAQKILWEEAPDPKAVRSKVPRELAVICGKAMEKDPSRRYQTMADLADDLRRYLAHEPIRAKPPTAAQRAVKWTKRNPTKTAASVMAAMAFAAISVLAAQLQQRGGELQAQTEAATESAELATARAEELTRANEALEAERQAAEEAREEASSEREFAQAMFGRYQEVANFQARTLSGADPAAMGQAIRQELLSQVRWISDKAWPGAEGGPAKDLEELLSSADFTGLALEALQREVFERALQEIEGFSDQPELQAQLLQSIATTQRELGLNKEALGPQERAVEIRREALGELHPETLESRMHLAELHNSRGEFDAAERTIRDALGQARSELGDRHELTIGGIVTAAGIFSSKGLYEEAEALAREGLEASAQEYGRGHVETIGALDTLAGVLFRVPEKQAESVELFREAVATARKSSAGDRLQTAVNNLGVALVQVGELAEAESLHREALEGCRRTWGEEHVSTMTASNNLSQLLVRQGKHDEAEELSRELLDRAVRVLGERHPQTLVILHNLGNLLTSQDKLEEAVELLRRAVTGARVTLGGGHPRTLSSINCLATALEWQGRLEEAEPFSKEGYEATRAALGGDAPQTISAAANRASLLFSLGQTEEAEQLFRSALEGSRRVFGEDSEMTLSSAYNLASLLQRRGEFDEAEELFREVLEKNRALYGDEHPQTRFVLEGLQALEAARRDAR